MTDTLIISIGRNIHSGPNQLSDDAWCAFQQHITLHVADIAHAELISQTVGHADSEYGSEDTAVFVFSIPAIPNLVQRVPLYETLGELARLYEQDAIAATYGTTQFVEPDSDTVWRLPPPSIVSDEAKLALARINGFTTYADFDADRIRQNAADRQRWDTQYPPS